MKVRAWFVFFFLFSLFDGTNSCSRSLFYSIIFLTLVTSKWGTHSKGQFESLVYYNLSVKEKRKWTNFQMFFNADVQQCSLWQTAPFLPAVLSTQIIVRQRLGANISSRTGLVYVYTSSPCVPCNLFDSSTTWLSINPGFTLCFISHPCSLMHRGSPKTFCFLLLRQILVCDSRYRGFAVEGVIF